MTRQSIASVVMGDMSLLIRCGEDLRERGHTISAVITQDASVAQWAEGHGLKVIRSLEHAAEALSDIPFDWFFSIGNLRLVPRAVWTRAHKGAVNFHDGPLPRYAGLNAPAWALLAGETQYGVTWHALTEKVDEGDIYAQRMFAVEADETAFSLNTKCFEAGGEAFLELLERIENDAVSVSSQDLAARTYFARNARPKAAASIDFRAATADIERTARALSFGAGYLNPLALPKIRIAGRAYNITALEAADASAGGSPGRILRLQPDGAIVATRDGAVRIKGLSDATGAPLAIESVLKADDTAEAMTADEVARLDALMAEIAGHEGFFRKALAVHAGIELAGLKAASASATPRPEQVTLALPANLAGDRAVAGVLAALARASEPGTFSVPFADDQLVATAQAFKGYVAPSVPLVISLDETATCEAFQAQVQAKLADLRKRRAYSGDLISRTPGVLAPQSGFAIRLAKAAEAAEPLEGYPVTVVLPLGSGTARILYDAARLPRPDAEALVRRLSVALAAFAGDGKRAVHDLPLLLPEEVLALTQGRNTTRRDYDRAATVQALIEAQCDRTPTATALVCEDEVLTYAELEARANRVAAALIARGVTADTPVGLYAHRSCELVVGALGILKAGGAYVPLDPTYPADRVALMIEDSEPRCLLAGPDVSLPTLDGKTAVIRLDQALLGAGADTRPQARAAAANLAYVIYTSGSTGRPKGVMIEHRNVVNFFAGMDERVPRPTDRQPVWLAVTSLSFDISVLELFWTLARGFKVVIHTDRRKEATAPVRRKPRVQAGPRSMEFSLFYWGNDDGPGARKYQLLLEGARFADTHGFRAVWTPERHFHAFGGPFPNPAVTGAAVAAITRNIDVRAGSCVLPLHHPARVAEEWSVIDNMSEGRVAIAFASGWMPEDFVLRPDNAPPNNKTAMLRDIDVVRRLWRGEEVVFPGAGGKEVKVKTLPRPVQKELPIWLTTAGNVETFREAARVGANVLTHLLGQPIAEVAQKIKAYRETLAECGRDPAQYTVTLMLHTLIGEDRETVREQAREPMKAYLRSAAALIKQYAWEFPAFRRPQGANHANDVNLQTLSAEEMDAITEFAFLRYFDTSGLFGTVDDALARVEELKGIGVDEIACLIDFGLPAELALRSLEPLADVVSAAGGGAAAVEPEEVSHTFPELVARHGVTHLQCTPSMATMLLMDAQSHPALGRVRHLFLGGEAVTGSLVRALGKVTKATIENMYGPTETTIWSSTGPAGDVEGTVPLGTPIANTQLYVLDGNLRPLPPGLPGELYIGGDGVARGYLRRPELTSERFRPNPFLDGGRMYRTGDLVCLGHEGELAFLGRIDHQVKLRGHRIELGEIEACIRSHPDVAEAVVITREDSANDVRLVAYIRPKGGKVADADLRAHAQKTLPDFMVPAHFVTLAQFPLTPNAKVDRKALPPPTRQARVTEAPKAYAPPSSDVEQQIARTFARVLGVERVGLHDNFFALGGHSLLAVQAHRDLKANLVPDLSIVDVYRFPTVAGLASHIRDRGTKGSGQLEQTAGRAAARRNAMLNRRSAAAGRARE